MPKDKTPIKEQTKLEPAWSIAKRSSDLIWKNKKPFAIILAFYALAYFIAVGTSASVTNVSSTLTHYRGIYHGSGSGFLSGLSTFSNLIGSVTGSNSPSGGAYQTVLFISLSLVIIWAVRQLISKKKLIVREAFYKSSTPLIPFFLIMLLIGVEFIPLLIGAALYNVALNGNIAVASAERLFWVVLLIVLFCLSLFFVTSTLIALYLVGDGLRPMVAIKTARGYVKKRRIVVLGRIVFMPVVIFIAIGVIMLPVILIAPPAAQWVLSLLLLIGVSLFHSYMYNLSRAVKR